MRSIVALHGLAGHFPWVVNIPRFGSVNTGEIFGDFENKSGPSFNKSWILNWNSSVLKWQKDRKKPRCLNYVFMHNQTRLAKDLSEGQSTNWSWRSSNYSRERNTWYWNRWLALGDASSSAYPLLSAIPKWYGWTMVDRYVPIVSSSWWPIRFLEPPHVKTMWYSDAALSWCQ